MVDYQDRKARFDASFAEHFAAVLRFVERRVDDEQAAQDITADVFLLLWRKDTGAAPLGRGWLCKTASHLIGKHYRRRTRRRAAEDSMRILAVAEAQALPSADILVLRGALEALPPKSREILSLRYWDGLSAPEIAELLGMTTAAVWTSLSRARASLRACVTPDDVTRGGTHA